MSYILDALRKAEAERERGHVPGLHSQAAAPSVVAPERGGARGPWIAAGALAGVALLGAAGWWWTRGDAPALAPAPAPVPVAAAPTPATVSAPAPVAPPGDASASLPAPPTAAPDGVPPPPRHLFPPAPLPPEPVAVAKPPPAPEPAPAPAAAAAPAPDRIVAFDKLPAEVKRQLPVLAIGGAIYSESAAQRLLIVGGQLLHEGDTVAPGIVLEQIRPHSAVLRREQLRWEVSF